MTLYFEQINTHKIQTNSTKCNLQLKCFVCQKKNIGFFFKGEPIVSDYMRGYNHTVISYGQSNTGKNYSFFGDSKHIGMIILTHTKKSITFFFF